MNLTERIRQNISSLLHCKLEPLQFLKQRCRDIWSFYLELYECPNEADDTGNEFEHPCILNLNLDAFFGFVGSDRENIFSNYFFDYLIRFRQYGHIVFYHLVQVPKSDDASVDKSVFHDLKRHNGEHKNIEISSHPRERSICNDLTIHNLHRQRERTYLLLREFLSWLYSIFIDSESQVVFVS